MSNYKFAAVMENIILVCLAGSLIVISLSGAFVLSVIGLKLLEAING